MANGEKWYRIGFQAQNGKPVISTMIEVGTNEKGRSKIFFLAPEQGNGEVDMTAIHSINADENGYPNSFLPSIEEAKLEVINRLEMQKSQIQDAIDGLTAENAVLEEA